MSGRPRNTDPGSDAALQALFADVTPLPAGNRVKHDKPRPRPVPDQRLRDEREILDETLSDWTPWDAGIETGEELIFVRPGVPAHTMRRLRRGQWATQAILDLHGYTVAEGRIAVAEFLKNCRQREMRCVRIIHGKGLRSPRGDPVLKRMLGGWLMQRDEVLAFCQARRTEGGGGAVVILLKA